MKLNLYKIWNRRKNDNDDDINTIYYDKYKRKFTKYFRKRYEFAFVVAKFETKNLRNDDEIMQQNIDNSKSQSKNVRDCHERL